MTELKTETAVDEIIDEVACKNPCSNSYGIETIDITEDQLATYYVDSLAILQTIPPCLSYVILRFPVSDEPGSEVLVGPFAWNYEEKMYEKVLRRTMKSEAFGSISPKPNDPYQIAYVDSLHVKQLTIATGGAGSGKTLLALGYAMKCLEEGTISKIVIFANPHIASSAVELGFMPGTKVDKLLETSVGSILISKLGSESAVRNMIDSEQLVLMPLGDCRGYEVPPDAFVYFTEAQNTNVYLMKLFLQRTSDDCKVCIEGDFRQSDLSKYQRENGLQRAAEVFRHEDYAAHIDLKNIYRGRIARKAEEM